MTKYIYLYALIEKKNNKNEFINSFCIRSSSTNIYIQNFSKYFSCFINSYFVFLKKKLILFLKKYLVFNHLLLLLVLKRKENSDSASHPSRILFNLPTGE